MYNSQYLFSKPLLHNEKCIYSYYNQQPREQPQATLKPLDILGYCTAILFILT